MGLFSKIKEGLKKTKEALAYKLNKLFTGGVLSDDFFDELEMILLSADVGARA
ncbi:MAG: signal recognition particle receptor subunit alpha, partial [Clostridiales bacterium]|nr:signal recognition particle receptor subunit alpha [Clostridiales bacterium]